jgi:hypothetical protein
MIAKLVVNWDGSIDLERTSQDIETWTVETPKPYQYGAPIVMGIKLPFIPTMATQAGGTAARVWLHGDTSPVYDYITDSETTMDLYFFNGENALCPGASAVADYGPYGVKVYYTFS